MSKVLVIGPGGAGKSTLARQIAARTGLPLVHLDALYWRPGWTAPSHEEWDCTVGELVAEPAWIMDGNYGRTLPLRLAASDTVIFLDCSRWRCLWRLLRRRLQFRSRARPELPAGCRERLTWEFLRWAWTYRMRRRPGVLTQLAAAGSSKRVVILRNDTEVAHFLNTLAPSS